MKCKWKHYLHYRIEGPVQFGTFLTIHQAVEALKASDLEGIEAACIVAVDGGKERPLNEEEQFHQNFFWNHP